MDRLRWSAVLPAHDPHDRSRQSLWPWRVPPLVASLALLCTAIGALVLIGVAVVAAIPLLVGAGLVFAWLVALLLLAWAAVEGLAALERWLESDSRFRR